MKEFFLDFVLWAFLKYYVLNKMALCIVMDDLSQNAYYTDWYSNQYLHVVQEYRKKL